MVLSAVNKKKSYKNKNRPGKSNERSMRLTRLSYGLRVYMLSKFND